MLEYEITSNTCALIGISENETEVIEKDKRFVIPKKLNKVLNDSCQFYGSTLEGRIKGSQRQLGMKYKLPIMVESSKELIFFPTVSPRLTYCSWISLKNIKSYRDTPLGLVIEFEHNNTITISLSLESFEMQIFRATKLMLTARNRRNN